MDVFGVMSIGGITALGGGTIRDAIFLRQVPFWVEETEYLAIAAICGAATFFIWPQMNFDKEAQAMVWADAVGIGAFSVIGAQNAIRACATTPVILLCGKSRMNNVLFRARYHSDISRLDDGRSVLAQ